MAERAVSALAGYVALCERKGVEQWKPLVKMIKKWNDMHDHPVEPSFLIEVIALNLIGGPWTATIDANYASSSLAPQTGSPRGGRPAKLGPNVPGSLDTDPFKMARTRAAPRDAEAACTTAINLERQGRTGDTLKEWRDLFGPLFPLS